MNTALRKKNMFVPLMMMQIASMQASQTNALISERRRRDADAAMRAQEEQRRKNN